MGAWVYDSTLSTTGGTKLTVGLSGKAGCRLMVRGLSLSSSGRPRLRVSTDGGTTGKSGATDYNHNYHDAATDDHFTANGILFGAGDTTTTFTGMAEFYGLSTAQRTMYMVDAADGTANAGVNLAGWVDLAEVQDAVIIEATAGTFDVVAVDIWTR